MLRTPNSAEESSVMYYEDLTKYSYTKMGSRASLRNIGWLDPSTPFSRGEAPKKFIDRVATATVLLGNVMRGTHRCRYCEQDEIYYDPDGIRLLLGFSEAWLPSPVQEVIYIAPSLLIHYVTAHGYLPPEQVVNDIVALPPDEADWDTPSGAYRRLVKRYGDR